MTDTASSSSAKSPTRPVLRKQRPISETIVSGSIAACDATVIVSSSVIAYVIWLAHSPGTYLTDYAVVPLFAALMALNLFQLTGVYHFESLTNLRDNIRRVSIGWATVAVGLIAVGFFIKSSEHYSRVWTLFWFLIAWAGLITTRVALYSRSRRWVNEGRLTRNIVIVGIGPLARRLIEHFADNKNTGVRVIGIFDDNQTRHPTPVPSHFAGRPVLGDLDALVEFSRANSIDTAVIALSPSDEERLLAVTAKLRTLPVNVRVCPGLMSFHFPHAGVTYFGHLPLLSVADKPLSDWQSVVKSLEDRIAGAAILVLISPLLLAISVLVKLDSPGPVFFRQKRYGFNNQLIDVYKFRTMYHDKRDDNASQLTQRNDPRVTRLGGFLRKYSLDELPQFFNVLRGEMSIVGPRPHALSAKAAGRLYDEAVRDYASRHRVKPGITGWAQVNGWRGETDTLEQISKRVEHDLVYIENWSLWFDVKIIWMTIVGGFTGRNAF